MVMIKRLVQRSVLYNQYLRRSSPSKGAMVDCTEDMDDGGWIHTSVPFMQDQGHRMKSTGETAMPTSTTPYPLDAASSNLDYAPA